jgi:hypothetical protein
MSVAPNNNTYVIDFSLIQQEINTLQKQTNEQNKKILKSDKSIKFLNETAVNFHTIINKIKEDNKINFVLLDEKIIENKDEMSKIKKYYDEAINFQTDTNNIINIDITDLKNKMVHIDNYCEKVREFQENQNNIINSNTLYFKNIIRKQNGKITRLERTENKKNNSKCNNGKNCWYLQNGSCKYSHEE